MTVRGVLASLVPGFRAPAHPRQPRAMHSGFQPVCIKPPFCNPICVVPTWAKNVICPKHLPVLSLTRFRVLCHVPMYFTPTYCLARVPSPRSTLYPHAC